MLVNDLGRRTGLVDERVQCTLAIRTTGCCLVNLSSPTLDVPRSKKFLERDSFTDVTCFAAAAFKLKHAHRCPQVSGRIDTNAMQSLVKSSR
mmetsp:Transcript_18050/g.26469  ORF Transcript_18050/g.26469 Transcript_18050/m.26469 type:complete len:92 (+) Transcript_18050:2-277(+)